MGLLILLSDGSGLTSRQVATQAASAGHRVEAVSPTRLGPAGFTRHVRRIHGVPAFGVDPYGWFEATLAVLRAGRHDVLLPTQEQAFLLAREQERVRELGVGLAVPGFEAMLALQDKVSQCATLARLGLPLPRTELLHDISAHVATPAYLKAPIGTASTAVRRVDDAAQIAPALAELAALGALDDGGVVAQEALDGPLAMIQSVFDHGRLVAHHANVREREGINGGASVKRSIVLPDIAEHLSLLGEDLAWHGALSLDAVLTAGGPRYIDVNPRLVEPGNAWRAGVDLVGTMVAISRGEHPSAAPAGRAGVRSHQLLLAILEGARRSGRRGVARELATAAAHRGPYHDSTEELTPWRGDRRAAIPLLAATTATLVTPSTVGWFAGGAVTAYALSPQAWRAIRLTPSPPLPATR
jgi:hypothetical protein